MPKTATQAVRERPILFSAEMVRAVLDRRKTQTRRVLTPQPRDDDFAFDGPWWYRPGVVGRDGVLRPADADVFGISTYDGERGWRCPYGAPGDRLWVREAFRLHTNFDRRSPSEVRQRWNRADHGGDLPSVYYGADHTGTGMLRDCDLRKAEHGDGHLLGRNRPSIHMPRWASRLTLEVTGVRVERVQAITEADALAEGIYENAPGEMCPFRLRHPAGGYNAFQDPVTAFSFLWEGINAERGYGWDADPWVWVVEFRVLTPGAPGAAGGADE